MRDIKNIMLATDFSEVSQNALDMAAQLKRELACKVHVVHVFDSSAFEMPAPYYFMPGVEHWLDDHFSGVKDKGRKALDDLVPELGDNCEGHFLEGSPKHIIIDFAKKHDIDMIIMGTHGHSGLNHLIMGSVAEYVVRHAPAPVLTVRGKEKA